MRERYSKYKDSGVEWIGDIPEHWKIERLKFYFNFGKGLPITKTNLKTEGIPTINYGQIHSKENKFVYCKKELYTFVDKSYLATNVNSLTEEGDFIFADTSEDIEGCGNFMYNNGEDSVFAGYHTIILRAKNFHKNLYFSYLFQSKGWKQQIGKQVSGIKVYSITKSIISNVNIFIPPLPEQQAIVNFLNEKTKRINDFIADRERECLLLDELKQSTIAECVTKGINPDVKMKDSGVEWIGEIPEHWKVVRISNLCEEEKEINSDLEYKNAFKFKYGTLVSKDDDITNKEVLKTYLKYTKIKEGDIVINGLNLNYDFISQRVAICKSDGIITSAYVSIKPFKNVTSEYLVLVYKAVDYQKMLHGMGTGIRLTLSFNELKKQYLPIPPLPEQQAIVRYLDEKISHIEKYKENILKEIDFLKEYKQRLICDAVTGKIKVV